MRLRTEDIRKCPHRIMVPQHYHDDGSCRCDDPKHHEMYGWGYVWRPDPGSSGGGSWIASQSYNQTGDPQ
jgi:hypothetical protein